MSGIMTGKTFNQERKGEVFVKLTNQEEIHNGFQFQTGLNVDRIPFNPMGYCQPGGIYFCSIEKLYQWLYYNQQPMCYVRLVTIPDDALIWVQENKFKADRMILSERQKIVDLEEWKDDV